MRSQRDDDVSLLMGSAEEFGAFYARHEAAVLAYCLRRTGAADVSADLTAESFARALTSRGRFDPALGDARGWLFGIARHLLADSVRVGVVENEARRRLGMPVAMLEDEALKRIVELADQPALSALNALPSDQRDAVVGRVLEGQPYELLAADLRCSQSVARKRVSRALRTLRQRLEAP